MLDDVELWNLSASPGEQMQAVRGIGADHQEKLELMATYYSLQFLHMNLQGLDRLELALSDGHGRNEAYRSLLDAQGVSFQRLNAAYIDNLLALFLAGGTYPEFCICVVGTRSDQEDVDVLVVTDEADGIDRLNRALGKLVGEFFKRAGRLHLYIAERMRISGYASTVDEYSDKLSRDVTDFVMICELLSAEPLVGSWNVFAQFKRKVIDRFYGRKQRWHKYHEGFLRGLLGEMHALLVNEVSRERIDFKTDALRVAKGMALAGKVVNDIGEVHPVAVLDQLARKLKRTRDDIETLNDSLVFVETFRHLYQMLGVQEEEVELDEDREEVLERTAEIMGFMEKGGVSAGSHLVVHYFEAVERIRQSCRRLLEQLTTYVKRTSGYSYVSSSPGRRIRNVATELAESVRMFNGHIFFADVLAALKERDGKLAATLVRDAGRLRGRRHSVVIDSYLEFADSDPTTLLELMLTIKNVPGVGSQELFDSMMLRLMARMGESVAVLSGLLSVFNGEPALLNRFVEALSTSQRERFEALLDAELWDEEQRETLRRLKKYIWLRTAGSEFYRRVFRRVINSYPHFIRHLGDPERLRRYASGFLAHPESGSDPGQIRQGLADFYDVSYLACSIDALSGAPLEQYRADFVEFVDVYLRALYNLCRRLARRKTETRVETRDLFGLFACGGLARAQAFSDDYDLVMILNSDDPTIFSFFRRVAALMHRELVARGTLPQYRFSDHFGEFVVRFSQFRDWFISHRADVVDQSQLLGMRMVVGSSRFLGQIQNEIVKPHIFSDWKRFAVGLAAEMDARRASAVRPDVELPHIKEGPGGLHDVEHVLLILKARYGATEPVLPRLFAELSVLADGHAESIEKLREHHTFLRRVRDLYRLGVAARDDMTIDDLNIVAEIMGFVGEDGEANGEMLAVMVKERMRRSTTLVEALVKDVCGYALASA